MSKPTVLRLQLWFASAPRGFGWDMIAAYDQRTLNGLLLHDYIERFDDGRQLPLISTSVESGYSTDHLSRIRLREPWASFATSNLGSEQLRVSMALAGGLVITELHGTGAPHIATIREISPVGAPLLTLGVPLSDVGASIGVSREIRLDLSRGDDFRASFALDSMTQERIGLRFKEVFIGLPDAQKAFALGRLGNMTGEDLPVPRKVLLRLMAAPGGSEQDDGALLIFVNFSRAFDGNLPGEHSDFLYPIPADTPQNPFSATVMLFQNMAPSMPSADLPVVINELFFGEHLSNYAYAFGMSVADAQLAWFGHVGPSERSFAIEPQAPTLVAGQQQQFTVPRGVSEVTWSVRNAGPDEDDPGRISLAGLYTSPVSISLPYCSKMVVVSAEGRIGGVLHTSRALVSIVRDNVSVSPLFVTCGPGKSMPLSAESTSGAALPEWWMADPALGGKLSTKTGRTCTYTAKSPGSEPGPDMYVDIVKVRTPDSTQIREIHVLVIVGIISLPLFIGKSSQPESNRIQLQVKIDGVLIDLSDLSDITDYTLECYGYQGGKIDDHGVYTAPANASGIAILLLTVDDGFMYWNGFLPLPLPLWAHAEALRNIGTSLRQHVGSA